MPHAHVMVGQARAASAPLAIAKKRFTVCNNDIAAAKDFVQRHGWLSRTPQWFRSAVTAECILKRVKAGALVYRVGDPPGGMYTLLAGSLAIEIASAEHGPYVASLGRPGAWFGERAACTGLPRLVGLRATRDTKLLYLPLHTIHAIVDKDPRHGGSSP